jgi:zinc and cadmium transporter
MDIALVYLLIASFVIMLASLAGVFFVGAKLEPLVKKNLNYLVAFASGVFLIVTINLIFEALEFATSGMNVLLSVMTGFLFFLLLEKMYPEVHCHHDGKACVDKKNKKSATKVLIGDGLHNIGDGLLLAPIFLLDVRLGLIAAVGIFIHEFVQEISEFFVLKAAGYTDKQALVRNFLASSTLLIGALLGFYIAQSTQYVAVLIGVAAGAFLYILVVDLIPASVRHSHREQKYINYIGWTLSGVLLIVLINVGITQLLEKFGLSGHGHLHEKELHEKEINHDH